MNIIHYYYYYIYIIINYIYRLNY